MHFVFLVESFRTDRAGILPSKVNVVHVVEQVGFHSEALLAVIAHELLDLHARVQLQKVLFFVISEGDE